MERYGNDLLKILKLSDNVKRAKRNMNASQLIYEEACSTLAKEKQRFDDIFSHLGSDDHVEIKID